MIIRPARPSDINALVKVEAASWPGPLAADRAQIASRIEQFPTGQLVAELDGNVVAVAWSQKVRSEFFAATPAEFDQLTSDGTFQGTHDPRGEIYQLIGVGVSPAGRGKRLGRQLIDAQLDRARAEPGVQRILGFTRPVGYAERREMPIAEYVQLRTATGRWVEPMLAFHLGGGAKLISIHPDYRPADREAGGYGLLIEYSV